MRHCAKLPAMNQRPGCAVRVHMLRHSCPSPNPPIRATTGGTCAPDHFADKMLLPFEACPKHDQVGGERSPLRMSAPAATKAAISENCANPISPLTIRSEQPILK